MNKETERRRERSGVWDKLLNIIGLETEVDLEKEQKSSDSFYQEDDELLDNPFITRGKKGRVVNIHQASQNNVVVFQPTTYEETQHIVDSIKKRKPVILNLDTLNTSLAQRILDFLSGAVYAVEGTIQKVARGIFVLTPSNIDVTGDIPEEGKGKSFYTVANSEDYDDDFET